MKKTSKNTTLGMSLGMCFGVSIGSALGTATDHLSVGISLGMCIGMALGMAIGAQKDKIVNKQVEEEGYTIKAINSDEEKGDYLITIANKLGEEIIVKVPKSQMKADNFEMDEVVYLNDTQMIEHVYDKNEEEM